jgi:hypothetical protein
MDPLFVFHVSFLFELLGTTVGTPRIPYHATSGFSAFSSSSSSCSCSCSCSSSSPPLLLCIHAMPLQRRRRTYPHHATALHSFARVCTDWLSQSDRSGARFVCAAYFSPSTPQCHACTQSLNNGLFKIVTHKVTNTRRRGTRRTFDGYISGRC